MGRASGGAIFDRVADRRESIRRTGPQPSSLSTVASGPIPYACLATSPARAWSVSGDMDWMADLEAWELWRTTLSDHDQVRVGTDIGRQVIEVKAHKVIPPERLWWVAERKGA